MRMRRNLMEDWSYDGRTEEIQTPRRFHRSDMLSCEDITNDVWQQSMVNFLSRRIPIPNLEWGLEGYLHPSRDSVFST